MTQRIAESELEAAKEVAALEMELLKKQVEMQKEIVQKRLAAERAAAAAESLSLPASSICSGRTSRTVSVAAVDSEPSSRSSLTQDVLERHNRLLGASSTELVVDWQKEFGSEIEQVYAGSTHLLNAGGSPIQRPSQPLYMSVQNQTPCHVQVPVTSVQATATPPVSCEVLSFSSAVLPQEAEVCVPAVHATPALSKAHSHMPGAFSSVPATVSVLNPATNMQACHPAKPVGGMVFSAPAPQYRLSTTAPAFQPTNVSAATAGQLASVLTVPSISPLKSLPVVQQHSSDPTVLVQHQPYQPPPAPQHGWSRHRLKPLELPKFTGKVGDFIRWRQRFQQLVHHDSSMTEEDKLARLREALGGGEAEELVADVLDGPGAYDALWQELQVWYGGDSREVERHERDLLSMPRITSEREAESLKAMALKLRSTLLNLKLCGRCPGHELYLSVTEKVPRSLLSRYFTEYPEARCNVYSFADFLMARVLTQQRVVERIPNEKPQSRSTASRFHPVREIPNAQRTVPRQPQQTFVAVQNSSACLKCSGNHPLATCGEFKALTIGQRWELLKPSPLCICCFQTGHKAKNCSGQKCKSCYKPHHAMLHYQKSSSGDRQQASGSSASTASHDKPASTSGGKVTAEKGQSACGVHAAADNGLSVSFMTVPVTLVGANGPVQATAFLDSGSSCSFLTESLLTRLGLPTESGSLETTVLGGQKLRNVRHCSSLQISHTSGESSQLTAWVLPQIMDPVVPVDWTQQTQWSHIADLTQNLATHTSTIDLLIGLNAPWLHASLEERFSTEGGPIARRTPLGWVLFGHVVADGGPGADQQSMFASSLPKVVHQFWQLKSVGMHPHSTSYMYNSWLRGCGDDG